MRTVIIIAKCVKKNGPWHELHFTGVFAGESIKKILLEVSKSPELTKNEEYLIWANVNSVEGGVLKAHMLKAKLLAECWDKS